MMLLDLFCGAGGAAMGYHQAGFDDIIGIDVNPQPNYPFTFIQGDALKPPVKLEEFDLIHASPPCQAWTAYRRRTDYVGGYPDLIEATRDLIDAYSYVIENVARSPLTPTVQLCGSIFSLDVRRHRWFETNFPMLSPPCTHPKGLKQFPGATNRDGRHTVEVGVWRIPLETQQEAMGIDWMTREELSEAIPPAYTRFIGEQFFERGRR